MRKLSGYPRLVVGVLAVVMSVYHVYVRLTSYVPDAHAQLFRTLTFSPVLAFLLFPFSNVTRRDRIAWSDLVLATLSLVCVGSMFANYDDIVNRFPTAHPLPTSDKAIGAVARLSTKSWLP